MLITKFGIVTCEKPDASNTYVVGFAPTENQEIMLYFPIPEEDAFLIKFMLEPEKENKNEPPNMKLLGLYKTMLDGFESSGTFLSGVVFGFEKIENEELLSCKLCLSKTEDGLLENMMCTTFSVAVILSTMENLEIFMTDDLIKKLLPALENDDEIEQPNQSNNSNQNSEKEIKHKNLPNLPIDKDIEKIAKQIMSGQTCKNTKIIKEKIIKETKISKNKNKNQGKNIN